MIMKGIQYSLTLHLREVYELGLDINSDDLIIFEFLLSFANKSYCKNKVLGNGKRYFWVSHKIIIEQLPILHIKSERSVINHMNKLIEVGLLERCDNVKKEKMSLYAFGAKADFVDNNFSHDTEKTFSHDTEKTFSHDTEKTFSHISNNIGTLSQEDKNTIIPPLPPTGETERPKEKEKPKDTTEDFIEKSVKEDFKPIMREWCQYKREKKQSYKPTGLKTCYANLLKLSNDNPNTARQIIEQSMANNWAGLFSLKGNFAKKEPIGMFLRNNTDEKYLNQKIKQWK